MLTTLCYVTACTLSILHAKPLTSDPTYPPFTRPPGCEYEGKFYPPGEEIHEWRDGEECQVLFCNSDYNLVPLEDMNCGTTTSPISNTYPRTIPHRVGCEYEGNFYAPGEEISNGIDKDANWCFGSYCSDDGEMIAWDNFECFTTTKSTPLPTTTPPDTRPPGCEYEGKIYALGEKIREETDGKGLCRSLYCDSVGNLVPGDDFKCGKFTTTQPSNERNSGTGFTKTTKKQTSCEYEGNIYAVGDVLGAVSDENGLCYSLYCDYDGNLVPWYEVKCDTTTPAFITTPRSTTMKSSTRQSTTPNTYPPFTTPRGCEYEGKFYFPGEEFGEGSDGKGWCYGLYCDDDGNVIPWDNFNCDDITPTNPFMTTYPDSTTPKSSTTSNTISNRKISPNAPSHTLSSTKSFPKTATKHTGSPRITYPSFTETAKPLLATAILDKPTTIPLFPTTRPHFPNTAPPATAPASTSTSSTELAAGQCYFKGNYFKNGEIISRVHHGWSWCSGFFCNDGKVDSWSDIDCANPTTIPSDIESKATCTYQGTDYQDGELVDTVDGSGGCTTFYCKNGLLVAEESTDCESSTATNPPTTKSNVFSTNVPIRKTNIMKETKASTTVEVNPSAKESKPFTTEDSLLTTKTQMIKINPFAKEDISSIPVKTKLLLRKETSSTTTSDTNTYKMKPTNPPTTVKTNTPTRKMNDETTPQDNLTNAQRTQPTIKTHLFATKTKKISTDTSKSSSASPEHTTTPDIATRSTTQGMEITKPSKLCFHEDRHYEEGDIISRDFDGNNWCSGWACKGGRLIPVDCGSITELPSKVTTPEPKLPKIFPSLGPEPARCFHNGRYYEEGDLATSHFDGENLCSGMLCQGGNMVPWDDCGPEETKPASTPTSHAMTTELPGSTPEISKSPSEIPKRTLEILQSTPEVPTSTSDDLKRTPSTPEIPTRTPEIPTSAPENPVIPTKIPDTTSIPPFQTTQPQKRECFYKGKSYPPGVIARGMLGDGRCYGVICDISGAVFRWNAECTPREQPTTAMKATLPGCVHGDKYYPPGRISRISHGGSWCLEVICTKEGKITQVNRLDCNETTTTEPTTSTTTKPEGKTCLYNGMEHSPGVISEGVDADGWCYKVICRDNGQLHLWGSWHCKQKLATTAPPPTTLSSEKICSYNGENYPVGEITRGEDPSGWCYGIICKKDGQVMLWGSYKCAKV